MIFRQIPSGGDRNFAYLAACEKTRDAAVIDPSPDPLKVMEALKQDQVHISIIINTHSHYDHSSGNDYFMQSGKDKQVQCINCSPATRIKNEQLLSIGESDLELIPTPGHTPDSICIKAENRLMTGDTLFVGKIGGTYGREDALEEFESLKKIFSLDPRTEVWPGHDYGIKPSSSIEFELKHNPFIQRLSDFDAFFWLKENWAQYKKEHGIQ